MEIIVSDILFFILGFLIGGAITVAVMTKMIRKHRDGTLFFDKNDKSMYVDFSDSLASIDEIGNKKRVILYVSQK